MLMYPFLTLCLEDCSSAYTRSTITPWELFHSDVMIFAAHDLLSMQLTLKPWFSASCLSNHDFLQVDFQIMIFCKLTPKP